MAGQEAMREWREEVRREVPVWPWILAAAAIVYLAEGRMSARAAGRREARPNGPLFQGPERRQRA
jgi:hypothetical protein